MTRFQFILVFFLAACDSLAQVPHSTHFSIQKLAPGVYAAIATPGGYAICNAGIIDLGDETLVFDATMTPDAAKDLEKAARLLTKHKVKYLVNSHYHNDHVGGNQVFTHAVIISTCKTRDLVARFQPEEIASARKSAARQADELKNNSHAGVTEEDKVWLGYYTALASSAGSLKTVLPRKTFVHRMTIHGKKRSVALLSYGQAHTQSDLFMYLPSDRIAFMGDLLFAQYQPWVADGDMRAWSGYLDRVGKLPIDHFVPGHGPISERAALDTMKMYFNVLLDTAAAYHKRGRLPQNDPAPMPPPPFDNWLLANFYKPNLIAIYSVLYDKGGRGAGSR